MFWEKKLGQQKWDLYEYVEKIRPAKVGPI